jgi:hypothetical protein
LNVGKVDLELPRRETVAILRRMAELIERGGDGRATLEEIQRLRSRAARLRAELELAAHDEEVGP